MITMQNGKRARRADWEQQSLLPYDGHGKR
jgi:hypothetical protein